MAVAAIVLAACGGDSDSTVSASDTAEPAPGDARLSSTEASPPGFEFPSRIVGDRSGGVWTWTNSETESRLVFVKPDGSQQSWLLGDPNADGLLAGARADIAQAPDGTVWVGANRVLVGLDPATGIVQKWQLPSLPTVEEIEEARPASLAGHQEVVALAADAVRVVAAVAGSDAIAVFDRASEQFGVISTGVPGEGNDVAIAADGTVALTMLNYSTGAPDTLVLIGAGPQVAVSLEAAWVESVEDGFVAGLKGASRIDLAGNVRSLTGVTDEDLLAFTRPVALSHGRLVVATRLGAAIVGFDDEGRQTSVDRVQFPQFICPPSHMPPPSGVARPTGQEICTSQPRHLASDGEGRIYFTADYLGSRVGLIEPRA
jgi:hypothetical protein